MVIHLQEESMQPQKTKCTVPSNMLAPLEHKDYMKLDIKEMKKKTKSWYISCKASSFEKPQITLTQKKSTGKTATTLQKTSDTKKVYVQIIYQEK